MNEFIEFTYLVNVSLWPIFDEELEDSEKKNIDRNKNNWNEL